MLQKNKSARLVLNKLEFLVYLGWTPAERTKRQKITVDIDIQFANLPRACITDSLHDTFCYDTLNQTITKKIDKKTFRLLEHLTFEIYSIVKHFLNLKNKTTICVTKYPDSFLKSAGVSFFYSDNRLSIKPRPLKKKII